MISSSQSRAMPDVRLRVWAPQGAVIESLRQVSPEVVDLTGTAQPAAPLARDFRLGGWAPGESRDYHLRIQVKPGGVGDEMLAGRVSLVLADGTVATQALVRAVWTDDVELSTRMEGHVAHYNGQVELADAIQSGLAAAKAGDDATATVQAWPGPSSWPRPRATTTPFACWPRWSRSTTTRARSSSARAPARRRR